MSLLRLYKTPSYSAQNLFLSDNLNAFVLIALNIDESNSSFSKSIYKTSHGISHPLKKFPILLVMAEIDFLECIVILSNRKFSGISIPEILISSGISISFAVVSISTIILLKHFTPFVKSPPIWNAEPAKLFLLRVVMSSVLMTFVLIQPSNA